MEQINKKINLEESKILKKVLKEKGYNQCKLTKELIKRNYIESKASSETRISQWLTGKRNLPSQIAEGIYEICQKDERLDFIFKLTSAYPEITISKAFDKIFYGYITEIKEEYQKFKEDKYKIVLIKGLEEIVSKLKNG